MIPNPSPNQTWQSWGASVVQILTPWMRSAEDDFLRQGQRLTLVCYDKADLPPARVGQMIYVNDDVGGAVPAFSDGTNWLRVTDRAVIS